MSCPDLLGSLLPDYPTTSRSGQLSAERLLQRWRSHHLSRPYLRIFETSTSPADRLLPHDQPRAPDRGARTRGLPGARFGASALPLCPWRECAPALDRPPLAESLLLHRDGRGTPAGRHALCRKGVSGTGYGVRPQSETQKLGTVLH